MMNEVREHYDRLLGPIYGWMIGSGEEVRARSRQELNDARIPPGKGMAIDLGAGK